MNIWQEEVTLRFGGIDKSDTMTLGTLFGFLQEAAISHATELGVGKDALADNGMAWILSRISVFVEKRPIYRKTFTVKSWPRGCEKLFALRDYEVSDSDNIYVRGRSGWLIIDIEKRRPQRASFYADKLPVNEGMDALLSGPVGLSARENLVSAGERKAVYSDIDNFGHVNNVRYIQWIQDITPPDLLIKAGQMRFDMNYLSEIMPGETAELFIAPMESDSVLQNNPASSDISLSKDYPVSPLAAFAYEGRKAGGLPAFRAELRLGN